MGTTFEIVTYAEEEALSTSFSGPAVSEGLHGRICTHNPLASLFTKEILKFPPILCNFFFFVLHIWDVGQKVCGWKKILEASGWIASQKNPSSGFEEREGADCLFCQIFGSCSVNFVDAGR